MKKMINSVKNSFLICIASLLCGIMTNAQSVSTDSHHEINEMIITLYDVISGPAGARDWELFKSLFHSSATMGVTQVSNEGKRTFKSFTPEEYIKNNGSFFDKNGFFEEELAREINVFGGIAQVFTSYQFRFRKEGRIEKKGINCIQLARHQGQWKITNIIWEAESPGNMLLQDMKGVGDQVRLHNLFADHMVIQREKPIHVWGWSRPGSSVTVSFAGKTSSTMASDQGKFSVNFDPMPAGGPYQLQVNGRGKPLVFNDIYIGEVWICGGQSNMEWSVENSNNSEAEIANANYPRIRMLTIPKTLKNSKQDNIPDLEWQICSPKTIADFSAVGYFFGRQLHQELEVPIGLIDNAWGGTNIEGWMSEEAFYTLPDYHDQIEEYKNIDKQPEQYYSSVSQWRKAIEVLDLGIRENWQSISVSKDAWSDYPIAGLWEGKGYSGFDGVAWVSRKFAFQSAGEDSVSFHLGKIDDTDSTYLNGELIGSIQDGYNQKRIYTIAANQLKSQNELTIKIVDYHGGGGISSSDEEIFIKSDAQKIPLGGTWKIKLGTSNFPPVPDYFSHNGYPTNRYNAMVHPLTHFALRGEIYYQGESNARQRRDYAPLFRNMILDYREKWNDDEFAFLFVQLANFREEFDHPVDEDWPHLRLAQSDVLELPLTAMTTAIDIGEADDIHPRDKQTVGKRLANNALGLVYQVDITYEGPSVERIFSDGKDLLLQYTNIGEGLQSVHQHDQLRAFAITTDGNNWSWADARLDGRNRVRLSSPDEQTIIGVRYAHANNPGTLDLYNSVGLPAIPGEWMMK